jgi:NAD(P)-dependent dehydrogenase (short-subunit alcohol dehydrogenase family)
MSKLANKIALITRGGGGIARAAALAFAARWHATPVARPSAA